MSPAEPHQLITGRRRILATVALGTANLMVIFDMTIANVSVPHISGNLGITPSQGTWVITSYAVAEAISVALTGWIVQRFGAVRAFLLGVLGFGLFSILCGSSITIDMLVICRIGQGLCGGPLMPLTQMLIMRIHPPEKRPQAMGIWAMTLLLGPAIGPILGGTISDNLSWHWIFFINVPIVLFSLIVTISLLKPAETPTVKLPIDLIGLLLMVSWIGAFQIMLDIGREHDWFADPTVVVLGIVAAIGLALFISWELTEEHPIVDLRIFRYRTFSVSVITAAAGFGAYFAGIVVVPQWMQLSLGYTATQAGIATAFTAIAALFLARVPPKLLKHYDARILLSGGLLWVGGAMMLRVGWTSEADFLTLAIPQMLMGLGMPFFFITAAAMTLIPVRADEVASAAGLQSFTRTIASAIATSLAMTFWNNEARTAGSDLAGRINTDATSAILAARGLSADQSRIWIAQIVDKEALMLATNNIFIISSILLWICAACVWIAPRSRVIGPPSGGH